MKYWGIVFLFLVAACSDPPRMRTNAEMQDIAADEAEDQIAPLRYRIDELERRLNEIENDQKATASQTEAIADQVSHNAKVANDNALKDMTRLGACGKEWRQNDFGQWFQANKKCTEKDFIK